ncbi:hypothetical protein TrLO_g15858 [Triparma laevis f. longispina]|uniref:Uncharacterized protein n=1 Tax=Triparma laevis f. longispina TaxID=1714387 RepID=A0A9W7AUC0_9STRA|nr:hypothetical protein TrLO_g15858 [Triparma laevis f. longispina]
MISFRRTIVTLLLLHSVAAYNLHLFTKRLKQISATVFISAPLLLQNPAFANGFAEPTITPCPPQSKNCLSSSNIKDITKYTPPWSYDTSTDVAFERLLRSIEGDGNLRVTTSFLPTTTTPPPPPPPSSSDTLNLPTPPPSSPYITVSASRAFKDQDTLTFLFKPLDNLILLTTRENNDDAIVPDFGAQRSRLYNLRTESGFKEMGGDRGSADVTGKKESLGTQLKSFYGLQSGKGWEDLLVDE